VRERREREDALSVLEALAASALQAWDKQAREIRLLKWRENAVFRVVDQAGQPFVLRIHQAGYHSDAALQSELGWIAALQAAGVDVPAMLPTADGRLFVQAQVDGLDSPRQVDLQHWIDGQPLGTSDAGLADSVADVAATYRLVGALAARLHNQTDGWTLPAGFQRHRWDADGLVGERPLWGPFWALSALTPAQRDLLQQARAEVRRRLDALPRQAHGLPRYGLIHADFVPENLLRSASGTVRVIDFDDAGFGWHLFDLATALYFIQDSAGYPTAKASLIAGYREQRSLPDELLADLDLFMAARSFTYLGWVHTRPDSKDGQAILPLLIRMACREAERLVAR
jgi:Ser/Thr protein kinase RdoA (MazF antagonist)